MSDILVDGKIRFCILCFSVFLLYALPSFGASPLQLPEQLTFPDTSVVIPESKSPAVKTPVKDEFPHQIYEGTKPSHSEPANGKIPPEPKDSIHKHKHPIDMSTGKELLPMPVEPKR